MKNRNRVPILLGILATLVLGCIEQFSPPEVNSEEGHLVVDGFLNAGNDTSTIELRHSQNTNAPSLLIPESGAMLWVTADNGEVFQFTEVSSGKYILPPVNLSPSGKFRLSIRTVDGNEYVSDEVPFVETPPIDAITYRYDGVRDAMVINVNTHDPNSNTWFYKWKFEETYQYRAAYNSGLEIDEENKQIIFRKDNINLCWKTVNSTSIILGSTIKLTSDAIKELPINVVPVNTGKLLIKYSILVRQRGLSRPEFEYWTALSKSTQGTGSLFDPQPSQVTGNIKNVANPQELIFGFFAVTREQKKRIFMVPSLGLSPRCDAPDTLTIADALSDVGSSLISFYGDRSEFVLRTSPFCADCRVQGGTTVRPSFWE